MLYALRREQLLLAKRRHDHLILRHMRRSGWRKQVTQVIANDRRYRLRRAAGRFYRLAEMELRRG